jgi:ABC-type sugar transport system ATPase subunit
LTSAQASSADASSRSTFASDSLGLVVRDLAFSYPGAARRRVALDGVTFTVEPRRTLAVVGPSGAGKSTLLRAIAGLLEPARGEIALGGAPMRRVPARERRTALVFAGDALFETMSVRENLRFALRRGAHDRVAEIARALHVEVHLERMPRELSSGERQRVALARALLSSPRALLLDEPLAHLDPALRARVREALHDLRAAFDGPMVYVTHDHAEAMMLGDELGVLIDGTLEDLGPPQRVYERPANVRAACALGVPAMNLLEDGSWIVGIRPEHVAISPGAPLHGRIERKDAAGDSAFLHIATERGPLIARVSAQTGYNAGDAVEIALPRQYVRRFDRAGGVAIP